MSLADEVPSRGIQRSLLFVSIYDFDLGGFPNFLSQTIAYGHLVQYLGNGVRGGKHCFFLWLLSGYELLSYLA